MKDRVPQHVIDEERRKRTVRVLSLDEIEAIRARWKYEYKTPTNLELECLFRTADFGIAELQHILNQPVDEDLA